MDIDEALNTLKKAGFICEDTDTDDDEYWSEYNDQKLNKKAFDYDLRYDSYGNKRVNRSLDLKIIIGRLFNLANKLKKAGIDVEFNHSFEVEQDPSLSVSVNGTIDGEDVGGVICYGNSYIITDRLGRTLKRLKTADDVVDCLVGLN